MSQHGFRESEQNNKIFNLAFQDCFVSYLVKINYCHKTFLHDAFHTSIDTLWEIFSNEMFELLKMTIK